MRLIWDFLLPGTNYFGVFFGVLAAMAVILVGDGVLIGVYFLLRLFIRLFINKK